ncbi:MAG TPA: class I tRNA ligase family protein [Terriglobales bacterium]|nr:class I tRNA ligase family protein [Terriglobales bacterium]
MAAERTPTYRPAEIEPRWQARWEADRLYELDLDAVDAARKLYNLVEFPYPSAEGLHVGHVFTYGGADAYGRLQRMRGRAVFQPIGFDAFGIHTENFALKRGIRPDTLTRTTVANYRRQLRGIGAGWAWGHEVVTCDPRYYRWTQWVFLRLFDAGLAVRREAPVVWCPSCLTVLANEQVEGDRCERCGTVVGQRVMEQWFLRITAYADRLVDGLDDLDWPDFARRLQREWIGRSRGVEVDFTVAGTDGVLTAFTTRVDTLFGVTFLAVSPDDPRAGELAGRLAHNPATGDTVPIHVADYVVAGYGGGAVMGVPAHDERDWDFAVAHRIPVRGVVAGGDGAGAWTGDGVLVDSGQFSGLRSDVARERIADWLTERGQGRRATRYRLHDWLISRQRYWGPPIPIVYCPGCGPVGVPEADLPVVLPPVEDFRPTGTGVSPLASVESFVRTTCPRCGGPGRRETDVSDTFLDSAWYFLRYPSTDRDDVPWDAARTARLLPVDVYAGGQEHIRRHHLYARFMTHALHDLGLVPFAEPFPRILVHGTVYEGGAKMSKSRGNVINPDDYVERAGSDSLRMYLLFCGDWREGGEFSDEGLRGVVRFTHRLWALLTSPHRPGPGGTDLAPLDRAIAHVGRELDRFKFNTAIAALMELSRWAAVARPSMDEGEWRRTARTLVLLLAPLAPYLAEELWERLGGPYSVHQQPWPTHDEAALVEDEVTLVVQVDGRVRARLRVPAGTSEPDAMRLALAAPAVTTHLHGRRPTRIVHVPDRLLNLVT